MEDKKTALVTGACGFIGSHMVDFLLDQGYSVVATDTEQAYKGKHHLDPNVCFIPADITEKTGLIQVFYNPDRHFDYVFHIAAIFDYTKPPHLLYKVNVEGTYNLLNMIRKTRQKPAIVVWSSGSVYGVTGEMPAYETTPVSPKNNYERSKLEQERLALSFAKANDLPLAVIRPAAVYGPRSKYGVAIPVLMVASGQIPFIIGPGKYSQSFVHVQDVCQAAEFLATRITATHGEIYNICDSSRYTAEEMFLWVEKCLRETGRNDVKFLRISGRAFHYPLWGLKPLLWWNDFRYTKRGLRPKIERDLVDYLNAPFLMSNLKIRLLNFELAYPDAREGVKKTIEWYAKEGLI